MLDESSRKRRGVLRNALTGFVEACRVEGGGHGGGRGGVSCLPACEFPGIEPPANFQESNRLRISRRESGRFLGILEIIPSPFLLPPSSFLIHPAHPILAPFFLKNVKTLERIPRIPPMNLENSPSVLSLRHRRILSRSFSNPQKSSQDRRSRANNFKPEIPS